MRIIHKRNKKLNVWIQRIANPKVILSSLFAFIFVMVMVNAVCKQDFNYLTQTFGYTPAYAYQLLNDIGAAGRSSHLLVFLPDLLMVLLYTVLLVGANYAIFHKLVKSCLAISIITFSPLILSLTQVTEIFTLAIILLQYPKQMLLLAQLANGVTMVKTILTLVFFILPLAGIVMMGIKKCKAGVNREKRRTD